MSSTSCSSSPAQFASGQFLRWLPLPGCTASQPSSGFASHGRVVAGFGGLILLVLALSYFTGIFYPKSMPLLAFTDRTTVASALAQFNRILDGARAQGLNTSGSSAGLGIGFFLGIVGGVALLAGGLLGFLDDMTSPRPRRRPPTA